MTEMQKLQAAVDAIRAVCKEHGVVLVGTCESEGVYGSITIIEVHDPETGLIKIHDWLTNEVVYCGNIGLVCGIGDLP